MEDRPPRSLAVGIVGITVLLLLFLVSLSKFKYRETLPVTLVLKSTNAGGLTGTGELSLTDSTKVRPGQVVLLKIERTRDLRATVDTVIPRIGGGNSELTVKITECPGCFASGSKLDGKIVREIEVFETFLLHPQH
jgi:hypothetical protein